MTEWQPIETAPKDVEVIVGAGKYGWPTDTARAHFAYGQWWLGAKANGWDSLLDFEPMAWCDLKTTGNPFRMRLPA